MAITSVPSRRVLLIQAPLGRKEPPVYPLGLANLSAVLKSRHEVRVLDPNLWEDPFETGMIREFAPEVVGISLRNIDSQMRRDIFYYYLTFREYVKRLRKILPHAVFIVGGTGFSLFPEKIMSRNPELDLGVYLEAETSFPALLDNLSDPGQASGIFFRDESEVRFTGAAPFPSGDAIPSPDFDTVAPEPYGNQGAVGIQTKRGCPLRCAYCTYPHLNGRTFRMRPVRRVVDEIQALEERGVREITFVDGVFNIPRERSVEILEEMRSRKLNIRWRGWFTERGFDREYALLCKASGCSEFSFSPDGFDTRTLHLLGKNIRREDILRIYRLARSEEGIRVAFNFFWNPPGQSLRNFIEMILFAARCKLVLGKRAGGIIFGNPRIEPHTPLWKLAVDWNVISEDMELLPDTSRALDDTFFSNPSTRYLDVLFSLYSFAWKLKARFRGAPESAI